jgi:TPP-dependent 2-oxoacid decarboxylase
MSEATSTVGRYLTKRLEQVGLNHIFGVPGDYVLQFYDCLEESNIEVVCTCNELNAGYAADAYARVNGVGAVCVTYGVGGFSLFNAVVGHFAERLPVIIISGGPKLSERQHHHLLHHTVGNMNLQFGIYEKITAASVILTSPLQAPQQIDETIAACLRSRRPVYIEIPVDIVSMPCKEPGPFNFDTSIGSNAEALEEAASETASILESANNPVIVAGVEVHRLGLREDLRELVDHTGYPFVTTLLGKSLLPEKHPQFAGVYWGSSAQESVLSLVEEADAILSLGALMTDVEIGPRSTLLDASKMIVANSDNVRIKHHIYNKVSLEDFIREIKKKLPKKSPDLSRIDHPSKALEKDYKPIKDQKITVKRLYDRVNRFIGKDNIIVADTGDSLFGASELYMPEEVLFIDQAFYLSIGYSVPGTLGAKLAAPEKRPITFVGDGAFQMTAQELSTIARHGLNPVIFLINNDGYTIERVIKDGSYNDLHMWKYFMLPEVFKSGWGCQVKTEGDLEEALEKVQEKPDEMALIEVMLDRWDCSEGLKRLGISLRR